MIAAARSLTACGPNRRLCQVAGFPPCSCASASSTAPVCPWSLCWSLAPGFRALPDTLCVECYTDRLIRSRLLAQAGLGRQALATLVEPLAAFLTPMEVEFALERGRVAEWFGEYDLAARSYRFVLDAWAHADPDLGFQLAAARAGLTRVGAR
jgi:hypothetical protein